MEYSLSAAEVTLSIKGKLKTRMFLDWDESRVVCEHLLAGVEETKLQPHNLHLSDSGPGRLHDRPYFGICGCHRIKIPPNCRSSELERRLYRSKSDKHELHRCVQDEQDPPTYKHLHAANASFKHYFPNHQPRHAQVLLVTMLPRGQKSGSLKDITSLRRQTYAIILEYAGAARCTSISYRSCITPGKARG
jgi:hypothetical protein